MTPDIDPDLSGSDSRVVRRQRKRQRIIDALLELLNQQRSAPGAAEIAARAGVTVRTLFQYFADLRALYLDAADRAVLQILPHLVDIEPGLPLADRIQRFVEQRVMLCETVAPLCRAAARYDSANQSVEKRLSAGRLFSRNAAVRIFSPELSDLPASDRYLAVEALLLAGDWDTWDRLRRGAEMDVSGAKSIVNRLVWAALASGSPRTKTLV
jgi:AcrR family transcriptional regulator